MALWELPNTIASLAGNQPASLLDQNWQALAISSQYASAVSGTNAILLTVPLTFAAYATGMRFGFIAAGTSTGAVTANVNGKGAVAVHYQGVQIGAGAVLAGAYYELMYDGTRFQILLPNMNFNTKVIAYVTQATSLINEGVLTEVGSGAMTFTETADLGNNFDSATGRFTCPATGTYLVSFFAELTVTAGANETKRFTSYFADSGFVAGILNGSTSNGAGASGTMTIISGGSGIAQLTAGGIYSMWVLHENNGASGKNLVGGSLDSTQLSIIRLA